jgi:hypothetical protein
MEARKITEKNIFETGMLIHLQMGAYSGRKRLDKDQLKELPQEIVRGVHDLFDKNFKDILKEIDAHDSETRDYVKSRSIPFPIDGVYFIASQKIEDIIQYLDGRKDSRNSILAGAVEGYDDAIEAFKVKYPEYYERARHKYLTKQQFSARFYLKYQFIKVQAPSENDKFITPEMYKAEMAKFREAIEEMKREVLGDIYEELLKTTERLKKQSSDGKPNQRTLNNLNLFLSKIDDVYSDFIDRDDMKKAIQKVKASTMGISADSLRDNEALKKKFNTEISKIAKEIQSLPDVPMRRAIDF